MNATEKISQAHEASKQKIKIRSQSVKIELFGDIMKFSKINPKENLPFKKYDVLAIALVEEEKMIRILLYHMLCGLALSAHARRTSSVNERKHLFELKNQLFFSIANHPDFRRKLNFRFCVSKRFKIINNCEPCSIHNANLSLNAESSEYKFCSSCAIDRTYYNVLSMFHKYKNGSGTLFLGKEHLTGVEQLRPVKHVRLEDIPEQLIYHNYLYTPHNLISLELNSVIAVSHKLIALITKFPITQQFYVPPKFNEQDKFYKTNKFSQKNSYDKDHFNNTKSYSNPKRLNEHVSENLTNNFYNIKSNNEEPFNSKSPKSFAPRFKKYAQSTILASSVQINDNNNEIQPKENG